MLYLIKVRIRKYYQENEKDEEVIESEMNKELSQKDDMTEKDSSPGVEEVDMVNKYRQIFFLRKYQKRLRSILRITLLQY